MTHFAILMQKLFDSILTVTTDTNLLLRSFKDCHHTSCNHFEEVAVLSTLLEKFVSRFSESKVNIKQIQLSKTFYIYQ